VPAFDPALGQCDERGGSRDWCRIFGIESGQLRPQQYRPDNGVLPKGNAFVPAASRSAPLGGSSLARVAGTVTKAKDGGMVIQGLDSKDMRGAGVRVYEYASSNRRSIPEYEPVEGCIQQAGVEYGRESYEANTGTREP